MTATGDAMTATGSELLAAVIANPDDDQLRLVYADHLMELADPRGEFIQVQVKLCQQLNAARRRVAVAREAALLREHKNMFSQRSHAMVGKKGSWAFRRGFVDSLACYDPKAFFANFERLFAEEPIRRLTVQVRSHDDVQHLLDANIVGRLTSLTLSGTVGPKGAQLLAQSEQLASLRKLCLSSCAIELEGLSAVVDSPHFACTSLFAMDNELADDAAINIATSERMVSCKHLLLRDNQIGASGLSALVKSPHLTALKTLGLSGNPLGSELAPLLDEDVFPAMVRLELLYADASDDLVDQLTARWGQRIHL